MNGARYLSILNDKLPMHMRIHSCRYFHHDAAPCHRIPVSPEFVCGERYELLHQWPVSRPYLNPMEYCWATFEEKGGLATFDVNCRLKAKILKILN